VKVADLNERNTHEKPGQRKRVKSAEARKLARKSKKRSWDSRVGSEAVVGEIVRSALRSDAEPYPNKRFLRFIRFGI